MKKFVKITEKYLDATGLNDPSLIGETITRVNTSSEMTIDEMSGRIFGVVSDQSVDSDGDLIIAKGINIDRYLKNAIVLFNHDMNIPIGRCEELMIENDGMYAYFRLSSIESAQEIYTLLKEKVLRTLSIGFIPTKVALKGTSEFNKISSELVSRYNIDMTNCRKIIVECNMVEFSVVTIPANEDAIIIDVKKIKDQLKDIEVPIKEESKLQYKKIPKLEYKKIDNVDKIEYLRKWGI